MRADLLLVERGLFDSRARAQAAIEAGLVQADGAPVRKTSEKLAANARIVAEAPHPYVSRGGVKLAGALDAFAIAPLGRRCLDAGASTGGFTDCLLQRGAAHVVAVDTGSGQLHAKLRGDARVRSLEATDIRKLAAADIASGNLAPRPDLGVIDVSFISLALVLPAVARLLAPGSEIVALIKPQFEVGGAAIGKGGIVRDSAATATAIARIRALLAELGYAETGMIDSPIAGGDGNREYLIGGRRTA